MAISLKFLADDDLKRITAQSAGGMHESTSGGDVVALEFISPPESAAALAVFRDILTSLRRMSTSSYAHLSDKERGAKPTVDHLTGIGRLLHLDALSNVNAAEQEAFEQLRLSLK